MALDTADKRASAINIGLPFGRVFATPDGAFDQGDRQQMAMSYRGILATAEPEDTTPVFRPRDARDGGSFRRRGGPTEPVFRPRDARP
jgi:hypothetical protein